VLENSKLTDNIVTVEVAEDGTRQVEVADEVEAADGEEVAAEEEAVVEVEEEVTVAEQDGTWEPPTKVFGVEAEGEEEVEGEEEEEERLLMLHSGPT